MRHAPCVIATERAPNGCRGAAHRTPRTPPGPTVGPQPHGQWTEKSFSRESVDGRMHRQVDRSGRPRTAERRSPNSPTHSTPHYAAPHEPLSTNHRRVRNVSGPKAGTTGSDPLQHRPDGAPAQPSADHTGMLSAVLHGCATTMKRRIGPLLKPACTKWRVGSIVEELVPLLNFETFGCFTAPSGRHRRWEAAAVDKGAAQVRASGGSLPSSGRTTTRQTIRLVRTPATVTGWPFGTTVRARTRSGSRAERRWSRSGREPDSRPGGDLRLSR